MSTSIHAFFSPQATFQKFGDDQPNNLKILDTEGQDCVVIGSTYTNGGEWNDEGCSEKFKFVCEKSPGESSAGEL